MRKRHRVIIRPTLAVKLRTVYRTVALHAIQQKNRIDGAALRALEWARGKMSLVTETPNEDIVVEHAQ